MNLINNSSSTDGIKYYLRLAGYAKAYWKTFIVAIFCMLGTAATEPIFPAIMKYLLDNGFNSPDKYMIWMIPSGIIMLFLVRALLSFATNYLMAWISAKASMQIQKELFNKLVHLPTQAFYDQSASKYISRIVIDVGNANQAITVVMVMLVRESFTALALILYLLYLDWQLTILILMVGPLLALIIKTFSMRMKQSSRSAQQAIRLMSHSIEESVNGQKVVKIFGAHRRLLDRFQSNLAQARRATMREAIPSSAITPISHLVASLAVAAIIFIAMSQVTGQASDTAGGFVSFITAMLLLITPVKQLSTINVTIQRSLVACESIFDLMDADTERDDGTVRLENVSGKIKFDGVGFTYPNNLFPALRDVSFTIPAGKTYALVGASGGGKSTIGALLPRFYNPTSGHVLIDDIDSQKITLASLRDNIALVSQEIVLFNDTIEANIAIGSNKNFGAQEVIAAAKAANAWEFIQQLPDGINTMIGEDGARLSGGQRQRIAIARALLKNAPILILDEATSALDAESERQVQSALALLMNHRTTLVIAHRLSTIEHADQILVLDQGCIVERGTHEELIARGGIYANLNRMQT